MSESKRSKLKAWVKKAMKAMGNAIFSEKSNTVPPETGEQPYRDKPKKGLF